MDLNTINYWAVLVAALSTFAIGGVWYSLILFSNIWMRESGLTEDDLQDAVWEITAGWLTGWRRMDRYSYGCDLSF